MSTGYPDHRCSTWAPAAARFWRGYRTGGGELRAVELDAEHFKLAGVQPLALDLNTTFAGHFERTFELVTAMEIVEHLDSPRDFLRQIHQLLSTDGHLLISTPNIGHWASRVRFLLQGEMRYFKESDYHTQRHISPISDVHMRLMLKEIGFRLVACRWAGSFYGPLKKVAMGPASLLARAALGQGCAGDVAIYLAQKQQPDRSSPGSRSQYYSR